MKKNILLSILMCLLALFLFSSCRKKSDYIETTSSDIPSVEQSREETVPHQANFNSVTDLQVRNLQKLCKVWGYTKYTHPAFLLGKKDWDEELLALIPEVGTAESEENANDILYQWFSGLGEIDYKTDYVDPTLANSPKENVYVIADFSWLSNTAYLGEALSNALSQLDEIPTVERSHAPVMFETATFYIHCLFTNEKSYENMDYANDGYRLLGLFRLWNALEYYYPYLTILDDNWDEMLSQHIVQMLEGDDKQTYKRTLASLTSKLHDAHGAYGDASFTDTEFGRFSAPVYITLADDKLVVGKVHKDYQDSCTLLPGDVLLKLNGVTIENVIEHRKPYLPIPNDEKLLNALTPYLLRSSEETMEVTVLRNGVEILLNVQGAIGFFHPTNLVKPEKSHELLDHNIGLINPSKLTVGKSAPILDEFSNTDGLILDLRQYPIDISDPDFEEFMLGPKKLAAMISCSSKTIPGVFYITHMEFTGSNSGPAYDKPVVILMDETSQSFSEHTIMKLRNGPNVIIMGQNSVGANGGVTYIPLPDGDLFQFTGMGVYAPDGSTYQRIGLSPDIYVERTIAGVREGRDEFIEAAIQYIIDKNAEVQNE